MEPKVWPHDVNLKLAHLQIQAGKVRGQVSHSTQAKPEEG